MSVQIGQGASPSNAADTPTEHNVTAIVAARICHDLISPIGAIGNGLELLSLSHGSTPEMALLSESVTGANCRIRLFRLAFGAPGNGQAIAARDMQGLLRDFGLGGRTSYSWEVAEDLPRSEVQCALLALLCVDAALPQGGTVAVRHGAGRWSVSGRGRALRLVDGLFGVLDGTATGAQITPATVQFLLFPGALERLGRPLTVRACCENGVDLSF